MTTVLVGFLGSDGVERVVKFWVEDEVDLAFQIRDHEVRLGATAQPVSQPKPVQAMSRIGFRNTSAFLRR